MYVAAEPEFQESTTYSYEVNGSYVNKLLLIFTVTVLSVLQRYMKVLVLYLSPSH